MVGATWLPAGAIGVCAGPCVGMLGATGRCPSCEGTGAVEGAGCSARGGVTVGWTGVGVVMGCKVVDERVVVADCAATAPAIVSRTHSRTRRLDAWIAMTGTLRVSTVMQ
ncbi:conserved hypothetical protein [Xanthomonas citri pv. citri]|nr:conserved hypothetical protein [Xanthomonas citri pv. citri]CEJ47719.1 conserved hypothetical protein [Xanthomonas citri pv. bilvae]CEE39185.1 conserved hypothetical protein [Xanthomonas citri pv. citri]CEE46939.1 conserved hypothetical protein [Xanthomonas citri pv. citri]CEE75894.1 conserved hypothetical protein [Xanthomonas citri pv. citri]